MSRRALPRFAPLAAAAALACALAGPAPAQIFNRPPAGVPGQPADFDAAGQTVRIDRLENQVRTLNGQIEQLQNQNRRLEEALRKFQQDVEFRFQNATPGRPPAQRRSDVEPMLPPAQRRSDVQPMIPPAQPPRSDVQPMTPPAPGTARRGDAFDPAAQPGAPGAPRTLGTTPPSAPLNAGVVQNPQGPIIDEPPPSDGPVDLSRAARGQARIPAAPVAPPAASPGAATPLSPAAATPPKSEYGAALELYRAGQYEGAENGLKSFIGKNPKSRLVADATYYLGETYYQRGRHREAAEQYLKVSTDYAETSRAPDSMLRLGMALQAMGAKEQACATLGEVGRKYPAASAAKRGADREMKRAGC